jgi:hypothetical protein
MCGSACAGANIAAQFDLRVESDRNNYNMTAALPNPYTYKIAGGLIAPLGETMIRVLSETTGADDLVTMTGTPYARDEVVTLSNNSASYNVTVKDGTGNFKLSADCVLASVNDRLSVSYDGTNWCEISRSINGV